MNAIISPSLLSADLADAGNVAMLLERAGIAWLHLDVMDGAFVPNITFGAPLIASLRKKCGLFFDVHLMIHDPGRYLEDFAAAGADLLVVHVEAMPHPQRTLAMIRGLGIKAGIALNPDTTISRLRWLLPWLDMILVMGVNPGFSGQKFLPGTVEKTRCCRRYLEDHGYGALPVQVDGGVCLDNAATLAAAGATILVSGSAFFRNGNYVEAKKSFDAAVGEAVLTESSQKALENAGAWRAPKAQ